MYMIANNIIMMYSVVNSHMDVLWTCQYVPVV